MKILNDIINVPKEKIYLSGLLFFLCLLQHIHLEPLWGIDFLLLGLLFYVFFVGLTWFAYALTAILTINLLLSYQFQFFAALSYCCIPLLARKLSAVMNLNFAKYFFLCLALVAAYVLGLSAAVDLLGFKNILIVSLRNILAASLIFLAFRHTFYLRQKEPNAP
jgi:hypothetical protein